jgi:hypothetical protein
MDVISLEENLPMRKNNVLLATAIAATLVASMNASYAGLANHPECASCTAAVTTTINVATYSLVPIVDQAKGVIYGTHLFGSNSDTLILPKESGVYADAKWTIEGTPTGKIQLVATLQGASFSGNPILAYNGLVDPTLLPAPDAMTTDCTPATTPTQCTWRFGNTVTPLSNGESFNILYKLTKAATTLGTDGGEVKMTVKLGTVTAPNVMGEQTITVATGKDPFTVQFSGTDNTYIKVAVAEENKAFVTQMPTAVGTDPEYLGANEVVFGYMYIQPEKYVKSDNGYTDWMLGNISVTTGGDPAFGAGYNKETAILTTLTVSENGQFAASTGSNGSVYLRAAGQNIAAKSITDTNAVWELTDTDLSNMVNKATDTTGGCKSGEYCIPLVIKANGTTPINIPPENGPKVEFNLDYASATSKKSLLYPAEDAPEVLLTRYIQDGVSCWVFNVPFPEAIDELNLRIINDSTITPVGTDCVWGTLYKKEGKEPLGNKVPFGCPTKEGTLYIGSNKLWGELFPTVTGGSRGSMLITSTLAKMEVLALLRLKSPPCFGNVPGGCSTPNTNPLTNLSTGAHGVACAPNYR